MKVINTDKTNVIHSDGFIILDKLKPAVYDIHFNKLTGYSLKEKDSFDDSEPMYGDKKTKIDKIIKSFEIIDRNLGVILSGNKGMGKTLFARKMCDKLLAMGYPIILVSEYTPNFVQFINSIEQEVVVFFDEFEKVFANYDGKERFEFQHELLPLFDGTSVGKKLFLLTINSTHSVSKLFLGRPGRFHYHIKFSHLSHEDAKEYFMAELKPEYRNQIDSILNLIDRINANYDSLRAIAFELNLGESLKGVLEDLNIEANFNSTDTFSIMPKVYFVDGKSEMTNFAIDPRDFSADSVVSFRYDEWYIRAYSSAIKINPSTRNMYIAYKDMKVCRYDDDEPADLSDKIERIEFIKVAHSSEILQYF